MKIISIIGLRFPYKGSVLRNHCLRRAQELTAKAAARDQQCRWYNGRGYQIGTDLVRAKANEFEAMSDKFVGLSDVMFFLTNEDRNQIELKVGE